MLTGRWEQGEGWREREKERGIEGGRGREIEEACCTDRVVIGKSMRDL